MVGLTAEQAEKFEILELHTGSHSVADIPAMRAAIANEAMDALRSFNEAEMLRWLSEGGCFDCGGVGCIYIPILKDKIAICPSCNGDGPKLQDARNEFSARHRSSVAAVARSSDNVFKSTHDGWLQKEKLVVSLNYLRTKYVAAVEYMGLSGCVPQDIEIGSVVWSDQSTAIDGVVVGHVDGYLPAGQASRGANGSVYVWSPRKGTNAFFLPDLPPTADRNLVNCEAFSRRAVATARLHVVAQHRWPALSQVEMRGSKKPYSAEVERAKLYALSRYGITKESFPFDTETSSIYWKSRFGDICSKLQF